MTSPNIGPGTRSRKIYSGSKKVMLKFMNWMLRMVIKNPIPVTIVRAEPINSGGAVCAVRAENWGESPTTTMPHNTRNPRNTPAGA